MYAIGIPHIEILITLRGRYWSPFMLHQLLLPAMQPNIQNYLTGQKQSSKEQEMTVGHDV